MSETANVQPEPPSLFERQKGLYYRLVKLFTLDLLRPEELNKDYLMKANELPRADLEEIIKLALTDADRASGRKAFSPRVPEVENATPEDEDSLATALGGSRGKRLGSRRLRVVLLVTLAPFCTFGLLYLAKVMGA